MAEILLLLRRRRQRELRESRLGWRLRDTQNPFELTDYAFRSRFRLSRSAAKDLCNELRPHLSSYTGYSVELQVLSSLLVLGSGSFQSVASYIEFTQISQSTVSRSLERFLTALFPLLPKYINFPTSESDLALIKENFSLDTGFLDAVGAIGCTHINICKPRSTDWCLFLNRKGKYSVNIQMVCDSKMKIMDVVARWPGSSVNSYIWNNSGLRKLFISETIPSKNFLIGNGEYPLEPWLMIPYTNAETEQQKKFNSVHKKAQSRIDGCFKLLKSRFRCLHDTCVMQYAAPKACKIVLACAALHNLCLMYNVDADIETSGVNDDEAILPSYVVSTEDNEKYAELGEALRQEISLRL